MSVRLLVSTAAVCLCSVVAQGQVLLKLPFDWKWGDTPEAMIAWAGRHSLDLTVRMPADQPALRIVRAEARNGSLPTSKASAVEAHFLKGRLFEVTEHYTPGDLPTELFHARFEETRKLLIHEYGPLQTNRQERKVEDHFVTKTRSFHREPVKGLMLMLVMTQVEDSLRKSQSSRYSILYRNENFRKELANAETEK